jgi:hypothetical protein
LPPPCSPPPPLPLFRIGLPSSFTMAQATSPLPHLPWVWPSEWHLSKIGKQRHQNKPSWSFETPIFKKEISIAPHWSRNKVLELGI